MSGSFGRHATGSLGRCRAADGRACSRSPPHPGQSPAPRDSAPRVWATKPQLGPRTARLVLSGGGAGTRPLPAGPVPDPHGCGQLGQYTTRQVPSKLRGGCATVPRWAKPGPGRSPVCVGPSGRLVPSKHIGVHAATSHRMKPGLCWGLTQVGASAYTPRGRCRAAEGSALIRSPPGEAQSGREHNVCGCFGPNTAWLVQNRRGSSLGRYPSGKARSRPKALPRAPRAWAPRPIHCSAGGGSSRGECARAPHRAKPGPGRTPTCAGASAYTLLG